MENYVVALGFFDGIHLGHQALLRRAAERGREQGMTPALFTFDRSPREVVTGVPVPLLTDVEARQAFIAERFPGTRVFVEPFNRRLMAISWRDFMDLLVEKYRAGWLVAGHDFHFGYRNEGTPGLLRERAAELGLGCDIVPAVTLEGVTVSSTHIRSLLERGDAQAAARFLGRPYVLAGPVVHGQGLGTRLGAPTVNLLPTGRQLIPARGVYVTEVTVDGAVLPAVTNVGVRPTVDDGGRLTVESHLLGCSERLYGHHCQVAFLKFLRPETRFPNLEALSAQIRRDAAMAGEYFADRDARNIRREGEETPD